MNEHTTCAIRNSVSCLGRYTMSALTEALDILLPKENKSCTTCMHDEEWCDKCINYSQWEPLDIG